MNLGDTIPISIFMDILSLVVVGVGCLVVSVASQMSGSTRGFVVLRDIGLPLGLLGALAGALGISLNASDPALVYHYTAYMLVTAFYGGVVSGFGVFLGGQDPSKNTQPDSPVPIYLATFVTFAVAIWAMDSAAGIKLYFSPVLLGVFAAVGLLAIATKKKSLTGTLADASLFASMLCVMIGLIARFSDYVEQGLRISMGGLVLGLLVYVCALCMSYGTGAQAEINAQRKNWHWLELTGFLVFMYFAPETLREVLQSQ